MALSVGSPVTEVCEQVGNLPFGMLKATRAVPLTSSTTTWVLDQDHSAPGVTNTPPLAMLKTGYVAAFLERNLIVCDEATFCLRGHPLRVKVRQATNPPSTVEPPPINQTVRYGRVHAWVTETWTTFRCGAAIYYEYVDFTYTIGVAGVQVIDLPPTGIVGRDLPAVTVTISASGAVDLSATAFPDWGGCTGGRFRTARLMTWTEGSCFHGPGLCDCPHYGGAFAQFQFGIAVDTAVDLATLTDCLSGFCAPCP